MFNLLILKFMLQAKLKNVYKDKSKNSFRAIYTVHGTATEIATYVKNTGDYIRYSDDGTTPLIWSDAPVNRNSDNLMSIGYLESENRYYVDHSQIAQAAGAVENVEKRGNSRLADATASLEAQDLRGRSTTSAIKAIESVENTDTADLTAPLTSPKK
jgi:hypothetical protein